MPLDRCRARRQGRYQTDLFDTIGRRHPGAYAAKRLRSTQVVVSASTSPAQLGGLNTLVYARNDLGLDNCVSATCARTAYGKRVQFRMKAHTRQTHDMSCNSWLCKRCGATLEPMVRLTTEPRARIGLYMIPTSVQAATEVAVTHICRSIRCAIAFVHISRKPVTSMISCAYLFQPPPMPRNLDQTAPANRADPQHAPNTSWC